MEDIKKYQEMASYMYKMYRKYSVFDGDGKTISHPLIKSNEELKIVIEKDYKLMCEMKKIYDVIEKNIKTLQKLGRTSEYHDILYKCKCCGYEFKETQNIYIGLDFDNITCDNCKNQSKHKTIVKTIEDASNIKCEVDQYGRIFDVEFDSNGKRYRLLTEDNDDTMELEEVN